MHDLMIDLETLSTRPNAAIVAIGVVAFGPRGTGAEYHAIIHPEHVTGHLDPSTVAWWMQQGDEARSIFGKARAGEQTSLGAVLIRLRGMVEKAGPNVRLWGHGSSFDLPIIESAFHALGYSVPWGHRAARDTRTILELSGVKIELPDAQKHDALADARAQAVAVIKAAHALGPDRLWPELAAE